MDRRYYSGCSSLQFFERFGVGFRALEFRLTGLFQKRSYCSSATAVKREVLWTWSRAFKLSARLQLCCLSTATLKLRSSEVAFV